MSTFFERPEPTPRRALELLRARNPSTALSLLLLELHGPAQARCEQALRNVAVSVRLSCRRSDLAIRWGGYEFAILANGADAEAALRIAGRIQASLQEIRRSAGALISIGVAELEATDPDGLDDLFDRAGRGLRRAKADGGEIVFESFSETQPLECSACGAEGLVLENRRYVGIFLCEECHERSQPGEDRFDVGGS